MLPTKAAVRARERPNPRKPGQMAGPFSLQGNFAERLAFRLYNEFLRLVPRTCRRFVKMASPFFTANGVPAATYDDLEAVGRLALWKAAQEWKPDGGAAFPTFAINHIRFALLHEQRRDRWFTSAPARVLPGSLDAPATKSNGRDSETCIGELLASSELDGEAVATDKAGRAALWEMVVKLPAKQGIVLMLRYQQE